jgi:hypothetical protein
MDDSIVVQSDWEKFRRLLNGRVRGSQRTIARMITAHRQRSEETGTFAFWFAVLSPVLGVAAGLLALVLFNLR